MVIGHSSVLPHLSTEFSLLTSLYQRSKAQHRAQLFLRRLEAVLRLTRLVIRQYALLSEPAAGSTGNPMGTPGTPTGGGGFKWTSMMSATSATPTAETGASPVTPGGGVEGRSEGEERFRELVKRVSPVSARGGCCGDSGARRRGCEGNGWQKGRTSLGTKDGVGQRSGRTSMDSHCEVGGDCATGACDGRGGRCPGGRGGEELCRQGLGPRRKISTAERVGEHQNRNRRAPE